MPPISEAATEVVSHPAIQRKTRALAHTADVLARAGLQSAAGFVEATIRTWLRSLAIDRNEERLINRHPTFELLPRVELNDPILFGILVTQEWTARCVTGALADRFL